VNEGVEYRKNIKNKKKEKKKEKEKENITLKDIISVVTLQVKMSLICMNWGRRGGSGGGSTLRFFFS
jgi:hypothetical protein